MKKLFSILLIAASVSGCDNPKEYLSIRIENGLDWQSMHVDSIQMISTKECFVWRSGTKMLIKADHITPYTY